MVGKFSFSFVVQGVFRSVNDKTDVRVITRNRNIKSKSVNAAVETVRNLIINKKLDSKLFKMEDSDPFIYLKCPWLRFESQVVLHSSKNKRFLKV